MAGVMRRGPDSKKYVPDDIYACLNISNPLEEALCPGDSETGTTCDIVLGDGDRVEAVSRVWQIIDIINNRPTVRFPRNTIERQFIPLVRRLLCARHTGRVQSIAGRWTNDLQAYVEQNDITPSGPGVPPPPRFRRLLPAQPPFPNVSQNVAQPPGQYWSENLGAYVNIQPAAIPQVRASALVHAQGRAGPPVIGQFQLGEQAQESHQHQAWGQQVGLFSTRQPPQVEAGMPNPNFSRILPRPTQDTALAQAQPQQLARLPHQQPQQREQPRFQHPAAPVPFQLPQPIPTRFIGPPQSHLTYAPSGPPSAEVLTGSPEARRRQQLAEARMREREHDDQDEDDDDDDDDDDEEDEDDNEQEDGEEEE